MHLQQPCTLAQRRFHLNQRWFSKMEHPRDQPVLLNSRTACHLLARGERRAMSGTKAGVQALDSGTPGEASRTLLTDSGTLTRSTQFHISRLNLQMLCVCVNINPVQPQCQGSGFSGFRVFMAQALRVLICFWGCLFFGLRASFFFWFFSFSGSFWRQGFLGFKLFRV